MNIKFLYEFKGIILWLVILIVLAACKKEFEMADYKEIPVIYCFLNLKDSVHYVRVNRMFYAEDPYPCVKIPDSIQYKIDELEVSIERYVNDKLVGDTIYFKPTTRIPKDDGTFTSEGHIIYKSSEKIYHGSDYILRVRNKNTGIESWARTSILGRRDIEYSFLENRKYLRHSYIPEYIRYHSSLNPDDYDIRTIRFLYYETQNGHTYHKMVDWVPQWDQLDCSSEEGDTMATQFYDCYYKYLSEMIPVDSEVKRIAVGVDYMITIANEELFTFLQITLTPADFLFSPEYTNITNGAGIFSSRYYYTFFAKKLKNETIDTISYGRYLKNHRFADSNGTWH